VLIRRCPKCQTERPLSEMLCRGVVNGKRCGWDLTPVSITDTEAVEVAVATPTSGQSASLPRTCPDGHPVEAGDLICPTCGSDVPEEGAAGLRPSELSRGDSESQGKDEVPVPAESSETVIGAWRLLKSIGVAASVRDRYIAQRKSDGREAVLTLYREGAEPDPQVYDVLQRLPLDHIPEIIERGRWEGRPYEVSEHMPGGNFDDIEVEPEDLAMIHRIVDDIGRALDDFTQVGLRHRDLRPHAILIRNREPLDLVIDGFGSARLSDYDLDIVSPLETTPYMAPEAIVGGVAAASDWWSLGMMLLEKLTRGACFEGVNTEAFLIHVLANGVPLPGNLHPDLQLLLRGLLARDRSKRWQWEDVRAWLNGAPPDAPEAVSFLGQETGSAIRLNGSDYRSLSAYALAAAQATHWDTAREQLQRGEVTHWAEKAGAPQQTLSALRTLRRRELDDDFRLSLALKTLNPDMPLIHHGKIVTPGWLLENPLLGYALITSGAPDMLAQMETEIWLVHLKRRAEAVRARAKHHDIRLSEEELRIHLLSTSKARLAAVWHEKRKLFPDTDHAGLATIIDRQQITDEDLVLLLSAATSQFRSIREVIEEASELARRNGIETFDDSKATELLEQNDRRDLFHLIEDRTSSFARCGLARVDEWADQFRLERRIFLSRALALLTVPKERWEPPAKQDYVSQIISFFEQKITLSIKRGPLARMLISRTSARVDLVELSTERVPAEAVLDRILDRSERVIDVDPAAFAENLLLENRLRTLHHHATLYQRDTGINGLYLGFPFLIFQPSGNIKPRIAPILLWPIQIKVEVGRRGALSLAFDGEREEVRLNPALEGFLGPESTRKWAEQADQVLAGTVKTADVMDTFGVLATVKNRRLSALPAPGVTVSFGPGEIACAAVLFHVSFMGQAVVEDLRQLKSIPPQDTVLESCLRLKPQSYPSAANGAKLPEIQRFLTVASDPSQEAAVRQARQAPGLLVEGPPGTGKSQTIVNIVADAIGHGKSLLVVCQKLPALEVVHKRLVAEGLGNRVVMVKDINQDRRPVLKVIREHLGNLTGNDLVDSGRWRHEREQAAVRIERLESEIDRHHEALHQLDPQSRRSYREIVSELVALESGTHPLLDARSLRTVLESFELGRLTAVEEFCAPLGRLWLHAQYEDSPLAALKEFGWDEATLDDFKGDFMRFAKAERIRIATLRKYSGKFDLDGAESARRWYAEHSATLRGLEDPARGNLARWLDKFRPDSEDPREVLSEILAKLADLKGDRHDLRLFPILARLDQVGLKEWLDTATAATKSVSVLGRLSPRRVLGRMRLRRFLRQSGDVPTEARMREFQEAAELERDLRPIRAKMVKVAESLGDDTSAITDLPIEQIRVRARTSLLALAEVAPLADSIHTSPRPVESEAAAKAGTASAFVELFEDFDAAFARHQARTRSLEALATLGAWFEEEWIVSARARISGNQTNDETFAPIEQRLPTLAYYQQFRTRSQDLTEDAWEVFEALRKSDEALFELPSEDLDQEIRRLINREARLAWKSRIEQANPALLAERSELENKIHSLAQADSEMRRLNRKALATDIDPDVLGERRKWEDITRLQGARAIRLREFLDRGSEIGLMKLRPVWLMNPDVASRMLPLKPGMFDTVVYDEASQMPVEHALPTLYRSKLVVVSGDEKQLPPTSFFSSKIESDEAEIYDGELLDDDATEEEREEAEETWNRREIKDCPDLLLLARAVLPTTMLEIHYRSSYRELIEFSNASFYGDRLNIPARHPENRVKKVRPIEVVRVNGTYQHQSNQEEAAAIVDVVAEIWSKPREKRPSVGVVTFNRRQADLIEALLEERVEHEAQLRSAYLEESNRTEGGEDMGFFVKNVENVQGDERDVIVFSSTFGRNPQGTFRRNFGVLGQKGGERRLNVAVTRARNKIIFATSMPVAEVSDMLSSHQPPARPRDFLQGYLRYAELVSNGNFGPVRGLLRQMLNGGREVQAERREIADGFGETVAGFVRALGWEPVPANDGTAFGLDYAIVDPRIGGYGIGIECDAPRHPILNSARAREVWRPRVLGQAIPHVHRVSSYGWYHERAAEQRALEQAIWTALT
jgi:primosomal replication protein N''